MALSEPYTAEEWDNLPLGTLFTWMRNGDVWMNAGQPASLPSSTANLAFRNGFGEPSARILVLVYSAHERAEVIICGYQEGCWYPFEKGA